MPKRVVNSPDLFEPAGGAMFSPAFEVTGGRTLYISGQVSRDKAGKLVGPGDIRAQTRQVLENLKSLLVAAGGSLSDVVKTTIFVRNVADAPAIRELRKEYFTQPFPASTFVAISALAEPEFLIEIEAIAVIG